MLWEEHQVSNTFSVVDVLKFLPRSTYISDTKAHPYMTDIKNLQVEPSFNHLRYIKTLSEILKHFSKGDQQPSSIKLYFLSLLINTILLFRT